MPRSLHLVPVKARGFKSCGSIRIGDAFALSRIIKAGETRELISPSFCHSLSEVLLEIAEKQKRRVGSELVPHKKQRWRRCEKNDWHSRAHGACIRHAFRRCAEGLPPLDTRHPPPGSGPTAQEDAPNSPHNIRRVRR